MILLGAGGLAGLFALTWLLCSIGFGLTFHGPTRRAISRAVLAPWHVRLHRARWLLAAGALGSFVLLGVIANPRKPAATAVSSAAGPQDQENWCDRMGQAAWDDANNRDQGYTQDFSGIDMSTLDPDTRAMTEHDKRVYDSLYSNPRVRPDQARNVYYDECMKNIATTEFKWGQNFDKLGWINLKEQAAIAAAEPAEVLAIEFRVI